MSDTPRPPRIFPTLASGQHRYLARRVGISANHVNRVLEGKNGITLKTAKKLADAARVTLDELWEHIDARERQREALLKGAVRKAKASVARDEEKRA